MTTHQFTPTRYYVTLGSHEPALRVADGDTVITTTVDSSGNDGRNEHVTPGGNPQTGPFYVEGAREGDTLVVRLERIEPDRETGYTGRVVAANVVEPQYVRELPRPGPGEGAEWRMDREQRTATLVSPETTLGAFVLPLDPMIGCFGVAPARGEAISTSTSGAHGGNMDYRGFRAGVTVFFPVFVEGALFHLGDVHALQGDGEIVGTGIETSAVVQFTLHVLKGKRIGWPRGENEQYIFTVGNARPLDQCVQHATTEMLRWLQADIGLDPLGANILLGQCVEYDLGNIYDPAYTMVCKLHKKYLGAL